MDIIARKLSISSKSSIYKEKSLITSNVGQALILLNSELQRLKLAKNHLFIVWLEAKVASMLKVGKWLSLMVVSSDDVVNLGWGLDNIKDKLIK